MRKILLIATVFALFSCTDSRPSIEGKIENLSGKIYLGYQEKKLPVTMDSIEVVEGEFKFHHNNEFTGIMTLTQAGESKPFVTFMVDKAAPKIILSGDLDNRNEIKVDGSLTDATYREFLANGGGSVAEKVEFIKANPNSIAAAYLLYRNVAPYSTATELKEYKMILAPELHNSTYIQTLDKLIETMERVAVGNKFIDITLPDVNGDNVSLSSVLAENKYVLLDFWASWCPPCRAENPNVVKAFQKYNKKGFTVFGVSLDYPGQKAAWLKAIEKDQLTWTNVSDLKGWDCAPSAEYGVRSIPANFLIASDGTIVAHNIKEEELHQKLEELLGK